VDAIKTAPQQARSQDKLERLLDAGRQLFGERGFEGTKITDVAELAGCSVGVFYQRFADKDAFLREVQAQFITDTLTGLEAALADAGDARRSAPQLLEDYVALTVAFFRDNAALHRAFLHYEATHPGAAGPMLALAEQVSDQIAEAVVQLSPRLDHPDPDLALRFAGQVLRGALIHMVLHSSGPLALDDRRLAPELLRVVGSYLGIDSSTKKAKAR
jgi:AcrR family transcriptional regulator